MLHLWMIYLFEDVKAPDNAEDALTRTYGGNLGS